MTCMNYIYGYNDDRRFGCNFERYYNHFQGDNSHVYIMLCVCVCLCMSIYGMYYNVLFMYTITNINDDRHLNYFTNGNSTMFKI